MLKNIESEVSIYHCNCCKRISVPFSSLIEISEADLGTVIFVICPKKEHHTNPCSVNA